MIFKVDQFDLKLVAENTRIFDLRLLKFFQDLMVFFFFASAPKKENIDISRKLHNQGLAAV